MSGKRLSEKIEAARRRRKRHHRPAPALPMPAEDLKARIADAVHRTVSAWLGGVHRNACFAYALVGAFVAGRVLRRPYWPAAGTLLLQSDPADPGLWYTMDSEAGLAGAGEVHAWFVQQEQLLGRLYDPREVVDLSSRNYRHLVSSTLTVASEVCRWGREDPPPYVWVGGHRELPDWLVLEPTATATRLLYAELDRHQDEVREMTNDACRLIG